jgi:hypothetical protein
MNMKEARIKELLDKYWNAEASEQDEAELRFLLADNSLPVEYAKYKSMFGYFHQEQEEDVEIDPDIFENPTKKNTAYSKSNWYMGIAASLLILISVAFYIFQKIEKNRITAEEQLAYEQTKKALLLISEKLNKGKSYTYEITSINKAEEILNKNQNKNSN